VQRWSAGPGAASSVVPSAAALLDLDQELVSVLLCPGGEVTKGGLARREGALTAAASQTPVDAVQRRSLADSGRHRCERLPLPINLNLSTLRVLTVAAGCVSTSGGTRSAA